MTESGGSFDEIVARLGDLSPDTRAIDTSMRREELAKQNATLIHSLAREGLCAPIVSVIFASDSRDTNDPENPKSFVTRGVALPLDDDSDRVLLITKSKVYPVVIIKGTIGERKNISGSIEEFIKDFEGNGLLQEGDDGFVEGIDRAFTQLETRRKNNERSVRALERVQKKAAQLSETSTSGSEGSDSSTRDTRPPIGRLEELP